LSFKCLVLCKSYQLVVYVTRNHIKRIMMERENVFELTDIIFIYAYYIHLLILKIRDDSPNVKSF
jgi:hypothetical protein